MNIFCGLKRLILIQGVFSGFHLDGGGFFSYNKRDGRKFRPVPAARIKILWKDERQ